MDILKSDVSQIKEYIKTIMDNKEWLKNSQNDKEGKQNQKENKEKKGKASKKENTKIKEDKKWTTKTSRWQSNLLGLVEPNLLGLVEAHKQKEEEITIPGYETIYQNDQTSNSRGILIAVKDT